jgi:hypothetical protein
LNTAALAGDALAKTAAAVPVDYNNMYIIKENLNYFLKLT